MVEALRRQVVWKLAYRFADFIRPVLSVQFAPMASDLKLAGCSLEGSIRVPRRWWRAQAGVVLGARSCGS